MIRVLWIPRRNRISGDIHSKIVQKHCWLHIFQIHTIPFQRLYGNSWKGVD